MSLKTIKVNPIFLTTSGSKNNKTKKEKPAGVSLGQSNALKKKLIARIKNFQHNDKHAPQDLKSSNNNSSNSSNSKSNSSREEDGFKDDFTNSMQFLDDLAKNKEEHKQTKRNNATLKKRHAPDYTPQAYTPQAYMQIATELPPELQWGAPPPPAQQAQPPARAGRNAIQPVPSFVAPSAPSFVAPSVPAPSFVAPSVPLWVPPPPPAYSNLKNSARPTYRTWLRTTQKIKPIVKNQPPIHILGDAMEPLQIVTQPQPLPLSSVEAPSVEAPLVEAPLVEAPPQRVVAEYKPSLPRRKKITKTFKYKLGKHANGKVSVLIKNTHTRRKIQSEQAQLKRKSILDIKNHLRSKNFLKVGSSAPNDVLREMYEQSILAGQLENKAKETLIHNYFNGDK